MCGIAGYFGFSNDGKVAVSAACDYQSHRGPDDWGVEEILPGLVFGHRRLSILDLSPLGHQPMKDLETGSWLVFNGEIYNFKILKNELEKSGVLFNSHSDTEVLLKGLVKYGVSFLNKLEGMYAFAFYDCKNGEILLARDPMGIKPLYYYLDSKELIFASESKALLVMNRFEKKLSQEGLIGFLKFGAMQHPNTLWEEVRSLGPGEWLKVKKNNDGKLESSKGIFWFFPNKSEFSEREAIDFLQRETFRAVQDHLVADVPVGIFLSSGIDSTILAGLASEIQPGISAFTVCFGDHKEFDEDFLAIETSKRFGLKHERIVISEKEALDSFVSWLNSLDQPSNDGLNTFIISKAVRARGIKVAISGLGGDELFGGYPSFREIPFWSPIIRNLQIVPKRIRDLTSIISGYGKGKIIQSKMKDAFCGTGTPLDLFEIRRGLFDSSLIFKLLDNSFLKSDSYNKSLNDENIVRTIQRLEARIYMGNMLLRDTDICSMAHGLEVRVPFLDQRIVNFAFSLPGELIYNRNKPGKFLLKGAFKKFLPKTLADQPKRGFVLPFAQWYRGPLKEVVEKRLKNLNIVNNNVVMECWNDFLKNGGSSMANRISSLLALTA